MCVVSYGYGGLGVGRDGGDRWYECQTKPGGGMIGDAGALPEGEVTKR